MHFRSRHSMQYFRLHRQVQVPPSVLQAASPGRKALPVKHIPADINKNLQPLKQRALHALRKVRAMWFTRMCWSGALPNFNSRILWNWFFKQRSASKIHFIYSRSHYFQFESSHRRLSSNQHFFFLIIPIDNIWRYFINSLLYLDKRFSASVGWLKASIQRKPLECWTSSLS